METKENLRQDSAIVLTNLSGLSLRIPSVLTHMAYPQTQRQETPV